MTVAGIMSGTSADGVDVAVVRIEKRRGRPALTLLAHEGFQYPAALRRAVLGGMNAASTTTAELARLNWRLALAYADAVRATMTKHRVRPELIGPARSLGIALARKAEFEADRPVSSPRVAAMTLDQTVCQSGSVSHQSQMAGPSASPCGTSGCRCDA